MKRRDTQESIKEVISTFTEYARICLKSLTFGRISVNLLISLKGETHFFSMPFDNCHFYVTPCKVSSKSQHVYL